MSVFDILKMNRDKRKAENSNRSAMSKMGLNYYDQNDREIYNDWRKDNPGKTNEINGGGYSSTSGSGSMNPWVAMGSEMQQNTNQTVSVFNQVFNDQLNRKIATENQRRGAETHELDLDLGKQNWVLNQRNLDWLKSFQKAMAA